MNLVDQVFKSYKTRRAFQEIWSCIYKNKVHFLVNFLKLMLITGTYICFWERQIVQNY